MFKDKLVRQTLLGKSGIWNGLGDSRINTINIPSNGEEARRTISFMAEDGLILYFIRRIEKLEERVNELQSKKK